MDGGGGVDLEALVLYAPENGPGVRELPCVDRELLEQGDQVVQGVFRIGSEIVRTAGVVPFDIRCNLHNIPRVFKTFFLGFESFASFVTGIEKFSDEVNLIQWNSIYFVILIDEC